MSDLADPQCECYDPQCRFEAFECTSVGVDETNGRFGRVEICRCRRCGRYWLMYHLEYEHQARSGRWYRGLVTREQATSATPENAVAVLSNLPWYFYGGSYFGTPAKRGAGPLSLDA